ncbi:MAG: hypothetical protein HYS40_07785, partial [Gemmatimonadetes bacterium]|nr:hypothetical protein [Gemmatimonadota bacterium]
IVLTVGLLGLVSTAALVTRMIGRGQRSTEAAIFAAQRMELLRSTGCLTRTSGVEYLYRGSRPVALNWWTWSDPGNSTHRVRLYSYYRTIQNRVRLDSLETSISCLR